MIFILSSFHFYYWFEFFSTYSYSEMLFLEDGDNAKMSKPLASWLLTRFRWLLKLARFTRLSFHKRDTSSARLGTRHVLSRVVSLANAEDLGNGWVLRSTQSSIFYQGLSIVSHVFDFCIYCIWILQCSTTRHSYSHLIIYHQQLPFASIFWLKKSGLIPAPGAHFLNWAHQPW